MAKEIRLELLDVCCGRGGWTKGFMSEGFECVGLDLNPQPLYPGTFIRKDAVELRLHDLRNADFLIASTPCEQFSVHCMRHFHKNPPPPETGLRLFNHVRELFERSGKPYIMENVRCAERFVGNAVNHCGSFYLWGNAVPAVMPKNLFRLSKGFGDMSTIHYHGKLPWRRERESLAAEIPLELSRYIAQCAMSLLTEFPTQPCTDEVASGVE